MDTIVHITVHEAPFSENKIETIIEETFQYMRSIESQVSSNSDTNDVSRLAELISTSRPVRVNPAFYELLGISRRVSIETKGHFDITTGRLKKIWAISSEQTDLPSSEEIRSSLKTVDYRAVEIHEDSLIYVGRHPVYIDLGAIAKGYIIDRAAAFLEQNGITSGIVDGGGDLKLFGKHPNHVKWRIGVRHPRPKAESLFAVLSLDSGSVATSGDYERFFIKDGKRYHHILDPRTGWPADSCVSVTIVTQSAVLADAFATAVFVMGPYKGLKFLQEQPDLEGLILFEDQGKLGYRITDGLKSLIEIY